MAQIVPLVGEALKTGAAYIIPHLAEEAVEYLASAGLDKLAELGAEGLEYIGDKLGIEELESFGERELESIARNKSGSSISSTFKDLPKLSSILGGPSGVNYIEKILKTKGYKDITDPKISDNDRRLLQQELNRVTDLANVNASRNNINTQNYRIKLGSTGAIKIYPLLSSTNIFRQGPVPHIPNNPVIMYPKKYADITDIDVGTNIRPNNSFGYSYWRKYVDI